MDIDGFWSKLCDVRGIDDLMDRERGDQAWSEGSSRLTSLWKMASKPGS